MDANNLLCRGLVTVEEYEELKAAEGVERLERNERARERRRARMDSQRACAVRHCEHWAGVAAAFEGFEVRLWDWALTAEAMGVQIR